MNRLHKAISNVHTLDDLSNRNIPINKIHPVIKLISVILYIFVTLSFHRYALTGVLGMLILPIILFQFSDISILECTLQFKSVLLLLFFIGIANVFFDTAPLFKMLSITITSGWISLCVLILKGMICFWMMYILIATTGMESLCAALQRIHCPKILVTTILLTYRYLLVLLQESNRISLAYALRAPGQKGIAIKAWGSLVGQLLLRSMDRAQLVYESMLLRGFQGNFHYHATYKKHSLWFLMIVIVYCILFRMFPVLEWIGGML